MIGGQIVVVTLVGGPEVRGRLKRLEVDNGDTSGTVVIARENPEAGSDEPMCDVVFDMALVDEIRREAQVDVENVPAMVQADIIRKGSASSPRKLKGKK